ncbi:MAG: 4-hydroxythreonine-4-phosphate dehydrogenase PdxA [Candidatus Marinamargulisbacteria bacterium]
MAPILISLGDPRGIGSEVTQKAIQSLTDHPGIILFGHPDALITPIPTYNNTIANNQVRLFPINVDTPNQQPNDPANARIAYESIMAALLFSQRHLIQGLVTAPISKTGFLNAGIKHTDHTTLLAHFFDRPNAGMAFYSSELNVMLSTIHIPLSQVESNLTSSVILTAIHNAIQFATNIGITSPRIGVSGLNPHAGENGQFGTFETSVLSPIIASFKESSATVLGPISPDIIFRQAHKKQYDIVVAMYHDQGLIPIKLLAFDTAVNTTIGLPICRTSPDHGTAYDIAGTNQANPSAMRAAIDYVIRFGR